MWTILDKILDQVLIRASSPSKCFTTTEKHNNWLCQVRYNSGCSRADVPSSNIFFCLSSRRTTLLFFLLQSVWDLTFMVTLKLLDIKMCILYFMAFYQIWKNNNPLILRLVRRIYSSFQFVPVNGNYLRVISVVIQDCLYWRKKN